MYNDDCIIFKNIKERTLKRNENTYSYIINKLQQMHVTLYHGNNNYYDTRSRDNGSINKHNKFVTNIYDDSVDNENKDDEKKDDKQQNDNNNIASLSFGYYLEYHDNKGRSCGPGGIQFLYGEGPRDAVTYMSYFPQERDMFIFPAWLKHWVSPFHSDCTRISVSGNIHDSAPLNNITKFGPEYVKEKGDKEK